MGTEWQFLALNEANVVLIDCDHRTPSASASGYPYIAIPQIKQGRIELSEVRRISARDYIDWTRKAKPRADDVVLSRRCNPGETAVVPLGLECALGQNLVLLRADGTKVFPPFLRWLVRGPDWWEQVGKYINVGAVFDSLKCADIPKFRLPIPPLQEQRAIASALGSLDNKIELNRRMNETLEAMARGIFRDWFVDFGPTYAQLEGRKPYLAPDLWTLFPKVIDNEGKPLGWSVLPLDEMAEFLNGLALQKFPGTGDGDVPVIKIAELRSGVTVKSDWATNAVPKDYIVNDGDVLFSWSGSLIQKIWTGGTGALNQHLFKVSSTCFPKWLHYFWVDHHLRDFQAIAASKATTMGHIQRHHLSEAETVIGTEPVMKAADELIAPLFKRLIANDLESRTLAQTRDLLLPKLMSGEVRLKDAEKALAEVA
jgi:type I restriction enzyme S subunit